MQKCGKNNYIGDDFYHLEDKRVNEKNISIKSIFGQLNKKRIVSYIVLTLWVAVIMQFLVNRFVQSETDIFARLIKNNSEVTTFELETVANFGKGNLSLEGKEELVRHIAAGIGLRIDEKIETNNLDKSSETFVKKKSKNSNTLIKLVSMENKNSLGIIEMEHYIIVRLEVLEDIQSFIYYRDLIEDLLKDLGSMNIQTSMELVGTYEGKLTLDEMDKLVTTMIKHLHGEITYENRKEDLYTIYAYSGLLEEYITVMGMKINIHIAASYDEALNITKIFLGTPIIRKDY